VYVERLEGTVCPGKASETEGARRAKPRTGRPNQWGEIKARPHLPRLGMGSDGKPVDRTRDTSRYVATLRRKGLSRRARRSRYLRAAGITSAQVVALGDRRRLDWHGGKLLPGTHTHHRHLPRPRAPARPRATTWPSSPRPRRSDGRTEAPKSTPGKSGQSSPRLPVPRSPASSHELRHQSGILRAKITGCATRHFKRPAVPPARPHQAGCKAIVVPSARQAVRNSWTTADAAPTSRLRQPARPAARGEWDDMDPLRRRPDGLRPTRHCRTPQLSDQWPQHQQGHHNKAGRAPPATGVARLNCEGCLDCAGHAVAE